MKVNDLVEFLEYSDRNSPVMVGIVREDGSVSTCADVLFLKQENRIYLIVEPAHQLTSANDLLDADQLAEFERTQLFGDNFVLLRKPPNHPS